MNLIEPILWHARTEPNLVAMVEREQPMSYGELADKALRAATQLAKFGVAPKDQVGLCLRDGAEHITALLAIACLGATAVPIDPRSRPAEKARVVEAFPLRLAVVTPDTEKGIDCPKVVFDAAWHSTIAATDRMTTLVRDWDV